MRQIAYIAAPGSHEIHVFELLDSGMLKKLQTLSTPGEVQPLCIHPSKYFLYAGGVRPNFSVISYAIGEDGTLNEIGKAPLPASATFFSTDPSGHFLLTASYHGKLIAISHINMAGIVMAPEQVIADIAAPHSINFDHLTQRILVPCLQGNEIQIFAFDESNRLSLQQQLATAANAGPRHMAFHPKYFTVYCINELNSTIDIYHWDGLVQRYHYISSVKILAVDFEGKAWAADIHITPNGRFLYVSERATNELVIFRVSAEGTCLQYMGKQFTQAQPRGFNIDQHGNFLLAAGQKSNHIELFRINLHHGELSSLATYPAGLGPMWVTFLALP